VQLQARVLAAVGLAASEGAPKRRVSRSSGSALEGEADGSGGD
jgi:hypothetical protein